MEHTTRQSSGNFGFIGIFGQVDGDEGLVELPQIFWELAGQVLIDVIVGADETALIAGFSVLTFTAKHDAIKNFFLVYPCLRILSIW